MLISVSNMNSGFFNWGPDCFWSTRLGYKVIWSIFLGRNSSTLRNDLYLYCLRPSWGRELTISELFQVLEISRYNAAQRIFNHNNNKEFFLSRLMRNLRAVHLSSSTFCHGKFSLCLICLKRDKHLVCRSSYSDIKVNET